MSSIVEAAEEVVQEKNGVLKCILYAIPIFISYVLYRIDLLPPFYAMTILTTIMLLTVTKIIFNNVRSSKDYVHPRCGILGFIFEAIKLTFITLPIFAICSTIGYFLIQIQIPIFWEHAQLIYTIVVWSLLGSIVLSSIMFYSRNNRFSDAYNFKEIFHYCADILVTVIFGLPRLVLLNLVTLGVVTYIFYFFFQLDNYFYAFLCCVAASLNVAILAHFLAQVDYETVKHEDTDDMTNTLDTF